MKFFFKIFRILQLTLKFLQGGMGMANEWSGPSDHCPQPSTDRRMSEPARYQTQRVSPPMPPRPRSAQLPELHPNQEVVLDEVGEGEMVENKLVIPDEMMQYLNQVSVISLVQNQKSNFIVLTLPISCRYKQVAISTTIAAARCRFASRPYAQIPFTTSATIK